MASKKALARRLFTAATRNSAAFRSNPATNLSSDPGEHRIFRRFLQQRASNFPPPSPFARSMIPPFPMGLANLMDQMSRERRIQLEGLTAPEPEGITAEETRKLVRLTEVVRIKRKLKEMKKSWIRFEELVRICGDGNEEYGIQLAKTLDDSGAVLVFGNFVLLHPGQIAKKIASLIPTPGMNNNELDSRTSKELEEMEKQKAVIDTEANHQVRRELWVGLGLLVAQTTALMRLTFWELSWDVMEPICFFVTSSYFMGGYAFFLTTSKEPSFEEFYRTRFMAKQKQLMKLHNFDVHRYNHLRTLCHSNDLSSSNRQI